MAAAKYNVFKEGDRWKIRYDGMEYPYDSNSDAVSVSLASRAMVLAFTRFAGPLNSFVRTISSNWWETGDGLDRIF